MIKSEIIVPLSIAQYSDLSEADRKLVDAARAATANSYAPYSRFRVGAAILLSNGEIISGSNQENAAYPSGLCAERTAAFYAHAHCPEATFEVIAIAAKDTDGSEIKAPIAPCGACRQSLLEYENLGGKPVKVILVGSEEIFIIPSVRSLLPIAFTDFK